MNCCVPKKKVEVKADVVAPGPQDMTDAKTLYVKLKACENTTSTDHRESAREH